MSNVDLMDIERRLIRIEEAVKRHSKDDRVEHGKIEERISKIYTKLYGNGEAVGLDKQVDRLMQSYSRLQWVLRAIVTAILGLIVQQVATSF